MARQLEFGQFPRTGISSLSIYLSLLDKLPVEAELNKILNVPMRMPLEDTVLSRNNDPVPEIDQIRIENSRENTLTCENADKVVTSNHAL